MAEWADWQFLMSRWRPASSFFRFGWIVVTWTRAEIKKVSECCALKIRTTYRAFKESRHTPWHLLKEPCLANIFIILMDLILSYLTYLLVAVVSSQRYFLWILSL